MTDIEIIHGDCLDVMAGMEAGSVDLVITSPPYNLGNSAGGGMPGKNATKGHFNPRAGMSKRGGMGKWSGGDLAHGYDDHDDNMDHQEYVAWQRRVLAECWRLIPDDGAIFYNHKPRIFYGQCITPLEYVGDLPVRQIIIWSRSGGVNFSSAFYLPTHEWVVVIAKPGFRLRDKRASGAGDVWQITQEQNNSHPAPFPVALPARILQTTSGQKVLDPFAGSGTTGVACLKAGRQCTLIEKSSRYIPLIQKRLKAAETPLFQGFSS